MCPAANRVGLPCTCHNAPQEPKQHAAQQRSQQPGSPPHSRATQHHTTRPITHPAGALLRTFDSYCVLLNSVDHHQLRWLVQYMLAMPYALPTRASTPRAFLQVQAVRDGAVLDRPLRVAVIGGGPGGACAADTLAKNGIETYLIERKLDNCKVRQKLPVLPSLRSLAYCQGSGWGVLPSLLQLLTHGGTWYTGRLRPSSDHGCGMCSAALRRRHPPVHGGRV